VPSRRVDQRTISLSVAQNYRQTHALLQRDGLEHAAAISPGIDGARVLRVDRQGIDRGVAGKASVGGEALLSRSNSIHVEIAPAKLSDPTSGRGLTEDGDDLLQGPSIE
jgi:hypothetical protein